MSLHAPVLIAGTNHCYPQIVSHSPSQAMNRIDVNTTLSVRNLFITSRESSLIATLVYNVSRDVSCDEAGIRPSYYCLKSLKSCAGLMGLVDEVMPIQSHSISRFKVKHN